MEQYLLKNCDQQNNYILLTHFNEIFKGLDISFTKDDIKYIFFFYVNIKKGITITAFYTDRIYLLIGNKETINEEEETKENIETKENVESINEETKKEEVTNKIYELKSLKSLITSKLISGNQMKYLNIDKSKFLKCNSDFDISKYTEIKVNNKILNLSNNYVITSEKLNEIITNDIDKYKDIEEVILNNNLRISDLEFLHNFHSLKLLNIWYMSLLKISTFDNFNKICRQLQVFNIHYSFNLNIRILIPLLKMHNIKKILIDDPKFYCQYDQNHPFISNDEWRLLNNESLQSLSINSENMNTDIIDYIFMSCENIVDIIINSTVHKICMQNLLNGTENDRYVKFIKWEDVIMNAPVITAVKWRPTFKNMYKNNSNMTYKYI